MIKISLIITVLNEAKTIQDLLMSVAGQLRPPDEVVIVDAGSNDDTVKLIKMCVVQHPKLKIRFFVKPGNRSLGRNLAIKKAKYDWIAMTDAGCVLDDNWLAKLIKPIQKITNPDLAMQTVVAGYYRGWPQSRLEQAIVPYTLVMPDRLKADSFLPAARSMLLHRSVFERVGRFNESLDVSEDYALAHLLARDKQVKIVLAQEAIVNWRPKQNLNEFIIMVYQMARDDARASVVRPKVWLIFGRYLLVAGLLGLRFIFQIQLALSLGSLLLIIYALWAVAKNYRYAPKAWYWLPVLQVSSDLAVMLGTTTGLIGKKK